MILRRPALCAAATRLGSAAGSKHASHTAALLPCEAWDEGQVLRWLREDVSLPQLEPAFAQWRVDGPLLLELDTTDLEEMGVDSRLQRKRVMNKIDQLRALSMAKALATPNHKPRRVCERRPSFFGINAETKEENRFTVGTSSGAHATEIVVSTP